MDGKLTTEILAKVLPDWLIESLADDLDVVERNRKVDIVLLVWSLILGFPAGARRTLASLRRRFQQVSAESIARSSLHDRLTPGLAALLRRLVDWCLEMRTEHARSDIAERMEGFRSLLAVDSTVIRLHEMLAPKWEATNEGQAACKMHIVADIVDTAANSVQLTDQRTHDQGPWKTIGSWVENTLLLMDLGYYDFHLFHRIDQQDGSFVSRVKSNANPTIVRSNRSCRGRSIDLAGKKLQDVLGRLKRQVIDVTVALDVQLRKYRGRRRTCTRHFRMVGVRDDESGDYRLYFTNVDGEKLTPEDVAETYRLRWQIELLFTRLKTTMRLHQLPSSKEHVVRALIWASVLALLVSNVLMQAMRQMRPNRVFPAQRMDAVFRDFAELILWEIAARRRNQPLDTFRLMLREAADPNRTRTRSHDIVDNIPMAETPDSGGPANAAA